MIRKHIQYSGNVQGVGFRYTAVRTAGSFDVTGHVRNTPDGCVEMIVEGAPAEVEAFLDELASQMRGHIRHTKTNDAPHTGQFNEFTIRH